jgi:hypothetical protein
MNNPLAVDPECAQLASLIIKQAAMDNFGFSKKQTRTLQSTDRGRELWNLLNQAKSSTSKFDFSRFCREACSQEYGATRRCFKAARSQYPHDDPRQVCFGQILDLCKRVEFVWTDTVFKANRY